MNGEDNNNYDAAGSQDDDYDDNDAAGSHDDDYADDDDNTP